MEQNHPEAPSPCVNNCGFFGSASTMNMCSKCHRDSVLNQQQAKLAESSIASIRNGSSSNSSFEPLAVNPSSADALTLITQTAVASSLDTSVKEKPKETPTRCSTCRKRVGLTGFNCRCGNYFCAVHRYSDKHSCDYDYRTAGRDAIAKANPTIKADKLDKI